MSLVSRTIRSRLPLLLSRSISTSLPKIPKSSTFKSIPKKFIIPSSQRCQHTLEKPLFRKPLLSKILIANRGEIAVRVIKTCKKLGIKTVAVYSEADSQSLHVKMADEAYCIGPASSSESYLRGDRIIQVAKMTGAKGIHPGYGFLSENAQFADQVEKEGLIFIGPPSKAIIDMGSKSESKHLMQEANVPVVPGYHEEDQSISTLKSAAIKIGFPVIIKAVKGGGGKGMRIVETETDFESQLASAQREAKRSFGDDRVLVEKYLARPRHVEVQIFADSHGNVIHLFERDCSVQRRHQKIIEEAPAPNLPQELRKLMGKSAVDAARAVNYRGAGTVEFILDATTLSSSNPSDWKYYFMEMNTRLQVEHPVSEYVTGQDLVEWQLEVASGNLLPITRQEDVGENGEPIGWSFETRIYAEDPENNFYPSPGTLKHLKFPDTNQYLRVETGILPGDTVGVTYDPMIAKLVTWGRDRPEALRRMKEALEGLQVVGPSTNVEFLKRLCENSWFVKGEVETGFIGMHMDELFPKVDEVPNNVGLVLAGLGTMMYQGALPMVKNPDPWKAFAGFGLNHSSSCKIPISWNIGRSEDKELEMEGEVEVVFLDQDLYNVVCRRKGDKGSLGEELFKVEGVKLLSQVQNDGTIHLMIDVPSTPMSRIVQGTIVVQTEDGNQKQGMASVFVDGKLYKIGLPIPEHVKQMHKMEQQGSVLTPMPCKIISILVEPGKQVEKGTPMVVLEAMKMEHVIKAPQSGKIEKVLYKVGDTVGEGKALIQFESSGSSDVEK